MADDDLRIKLGKSKVEHRDRTRPPWPPEVWHAAIAAQARGEMPPEPRFPVVISADGGPLDSPEKLQELADLPDLPQVSTTRITDLCGHTDNGEVQICDVNYEQLLVLKSRTEGDDILVMFPHALSKNPIPRLTRVVKSVNEGYQGQEPVSREDTSRVDGTPESRTEDNLSTRVDQSP